jgi:cob(I)alamin adenosyltransferase
MLSPMKIYTRSGDQGDTGLIGGRRVKKNVPRVAACGSVDELNALLGLAIAELGAAPLVEPGAGPPAAALSRIQNTLFTLGAELATPPAAEPARGSEPLAAAETAWLEAAIDALGDRLPPLAHFVLPGGSRAGATLHLARTVCRRAERAIITLAAEESVRDEVLAYVNRLSDYLFMLARAVNAAAGADEPKWVGRGSAGDAG